MSYFVGIDVGGTFTDVCVANDTGEITICKALTTPDIAAGVLEGLRLAAASQSLDLRSFLAAVERFGHGSTVAVNALLQRRGVRTGLITTRGFADTLWIARMMAMTTGLPPEKWTHYRQRRRPDPLIARADVREVRERIDFRGEALVELRPDEARRAVRDLLDRGIEALAICTLWSFRNPSHERLLRDVALELAPGLYVSVSSDLVPVIKEYERMATTVVNAYLGPVVHAYLAEMSEQLAASGFARQFFILNSVGGVMPPGEAAAKPVQLLGSGPSGGVLAARLLAQEIGEQNVITADMGGTSFDVGLLVSGEPLLENETIVGNLNLLNPMIGVRSIGTGGGSIARSVDGILKVGPESAGSNPGPACYGRGGSQPTVTDADLVLGFLSPDDFLGGKMRLDAQAAWEAIERHVATPLGLSVLDAAAGIREVADQHMADLLRQTTLERGHDPRDFCLFAYGGAGPLHACAFGPEAGVRSIVMPLAASVFSALGILAADVRLSRQRSCLQRSRGNPKDRAEGLDASALEAIFEELESEAGEAFERYGFKKNRDQLWLRSVGMRYARQVQEVRVAVEGSLADKGAAERLINGFDRLYAQRYGKGTGSRSAVLEIANCYLQLAQRLPRVTLSAPDPRGPLLPSSKRKVYLKEWREVPVYRRGELPLGATFAGPALVDAPETTLWIGPRHQARVDQHGNLRLEGIG